MPDMTPAEAIAKLRDAAGAEDATRGWTTRSRLHAIADTLERAIPTGTVVELGVWVALGSHLCLREPGNAFAHLFGEIAQEEAIRAKCNLQPGKRYRVSVVVEEVGE